MSGIFDQVINYAPPSLLKGTVTYKGAWSAATNTPTLINPPDSTTNGFYYVVSAAGTQFSLVFNIGDWIISNGSAWQKVDNTDAVDSVFGRTGAVVGVSTDYSSVGITATAVGASSPSTGAFTTLSSTSTTTLNSTTIPASKTLVVTTDKISVLAATTSAELAGVISDETGSGALVFATLPTFGTTGVKLSGSTSGTTTVLSGATAGTSVLTLPVATDTLVGKATTDTLTNKTLTSPTMTAPVLGTPASGNLASCTGYVGTSALVTVGALNSGSITSGFGAIDVGADAISGGAISGTTGTFSGAFGIGGVAAGTDAKLQVQGGNATTGIISRLTANSSGANAKIHYTDGFTYNWTAGTTNDAFTISRGEFQVTAGTIVGTFTSTGLNSTAIGQTTAAAGSFTTLKASGMAVNATPSSLGTTQNWLEFANTGGDLYFGQESSVAGAFFSGSSAYATVIYSAQPVQTIISGTKRLDVTSAGAAITGALSATGQINGAVGAYFPSITGAPSGSNLEIGYDAGNNIGVLQAYNRTGSAWRAIGMYGLTSNHYASGSLIGSFSSTGLAVTGTLSSNSADVALTTQGNLNISTTNTAATGVGGTIILGGASSATYAAIKGVSDSGYYSGALILATKLSATGIMTEAMRINHNGNVGIGTASPAYKLDIRNTTAVDTVIALGNSVDANITQLGKQSSTAYGASASGNAFLYSISPISIMSDSGSGVIKFSTGGNTEKVRIDSSGNLLVGTTTATASPATGVQLCNTSGTLGGVFIGHDTGTANGNYYATFAYASGIIGSITQSTTSAVLYNVTSDYRRKSNVKDLTGSGTFIDALKPRTFDWDTGDKGVGFIAHEFAEVSPTSVAGEKDAVDADGKPIYQGMQASTAEVIANLVAELQSLRKRLAALESK